MSLQVGAVGFVLDTERVYINTQSGWREIRVGVGPCMHFIGQRNIKFLLQTCKMFMIQAAPRDLAPTDSPTTDTPSTDGTIATPVVNAGRKRRDVEGLVKTTDAERLRDEPPSGVWRPDLSDVCRL